MRLKIWVVLCLLGYSIAFGQQPTTLQQAVQAVRDWLGDPAAFVEFVYDITPGETSSLTGPLNRYVFYTGPYEVDVDIDTMTVVGWKRHIAGYALTARTDLPLRSDEEIKDIALNYARQYFPHFNEFPNWDIELQKNLLKDRDETGQIKSAWNYVVILRPYYINSAGQKILMLSTHCGIGVNPYTGEVDGFNYSYMPMTLTNLLPNFSAEEAGTRMAQALWNLGADQVMAVMSSPDPPYDGIPDGLVIGATATSGLRLAYMFDYVVTTGAPGYEDTFGDEDNPAVFNSAIDAHTGELLYIEYETGSATEKQIREFRSGSLKVPASPLSRQEWTWVLIVSITLSIIAFLLVFLKWQKR